jgi:hypothetical protein
MTLEPRLIRRAVISCSLFAVSSLALFALAGCSASTDAAIVNDTATACHVASVAEAADPALAAHNQKIVAGVTVICATVPALAAPSTPTTPAPATVLPLPPQATVLPLPPGKLATVLPLPPVRVATVLPLPPRA